MSRFVADLWESIFTPGVTPTLLKATYGAFVMLIVTLSILLFFTRNVHVFALLLLSFGLVASLTWFLQELESAKAQNEVTLSHDARPAESETDQLRKKDK
jgi:hypothetical protein